MIRPTALAHLVAALRQAGARHLIADCRDLDGLVALLDRAEVP